MPEEAEETFTVRDRRRFYTEDDTESAATAETAPTPVVSGEVEYVDEDEEDDSEMEGSDGYDTAALPDVYSVLALFLGELRNLAWMRMGLIANPGTGQIERDLAQAKVAIDTVGFLASQLEPVVAPEERLPLKALVSDLQVNFVEQSKRGA